MTLLLNGSLGVGKTSIAHALLWRRPQSVLLECDALCNLHPFEAYDPHRIDALTDILGFMVEKYRSLGYEHFLVDGIFEKAAEIARLESVLASSGGSLAHVLLVAPEARRLANIQKRKRENHVWEVERSAELQAVLLNEFQGRPGVTIVDTAGQSVAEVAEVLLAGLP